MAEKGSRGRGRGRGRARVRVARTIALRATPLLEEEILTFLNETLQGKGKGVMLPFNSIKGNGKG